MAAQSPTVRLKLLTMELRRLRDVSGKTIEEVAEHVGISKSALSRIENGLVGVKTPVLRSLLEEYQAPPVLREQLHSLAADARQRGWWQTAGGDLTSDVTRTLIGLEAEASDINTFSSIGLAGLVQTRGYARHLIRGTLHKPPPEELEEMVEVRLRRQERIGKLDLWTIITEEVLLRPVGGTDVMREQLQHLIELAQHARVDVQVLPLEAGEHVGQRGPFTVLRFDPPVELQAVYLEGNRWEACIEDAATVEPYQRDFELLRAKALDPDSSVTFIRRLIERDYS
jgi:transcriptional regulator with XRE-family HTH domain